MNRFLKTFMLWLLVFALPAQALASAMRLSCGPDHHLNVTAAAAPSHSAHTHDLDEGSGAHQQLELDSAKYSAATAHISLSDSSAAQEQYKSAYCSSCAACCVGAIAPPSNISWVNAHPNSFVPIVPTIFLFTGHISAGLERPPKLILA